MSARTAGEHWRISSFSGNNGTCVEVAPGPGRRVGLRDSSALAAGTLVVSSIAMDAFVSRIKSHRAGRWRTSSFSGHNGTCVQVAALPDGRVAMRNSNSPDAGTVHFTRAEIDAFLKGVKNNEFDDLA